MKTLIALISFSLVSSVALAAPGAPDATAPKAAAPTPESIDKLLELTGVEKLNASVIHQLGQMTNNIVARTFQAQKPGSGSDQLRDDATKRLQAIVAEDLAWEKMRPVYAQIYSENFTQEDVDGVIAFYESKAQQDYAAKMPLVTQRTYSQIQQRIGPIMKKMQAAMKEVTAQLQPQEKAASPEAPKAASPETPKPAPAPVPAAPAH